MVLAQRQKWDLLEKVSLTLLTFSSLIAEDLWLSLDFPSDRHVFINFAGGCKNQEIYEDQMGVKISNVLGGP